jgi:hypothetical protein
MGYFSNGTEGAIYESTFCRRCVHYDHKLGEDKPCPVWMAHFLYAYELCNEEEHPGKVMLDMLIPREEPGLNGNGRCRMFVQDPAKEPLPAWIEEHVL